MLLISNVKMTLHVPVCTDRSAVACVVRQVLWTSDGAVQPTCCSLRYCRQHELAEGQTAVGSVCLSEHLLAAAAASPPAEAVLDTASIVLG